MNKYLWFLALALFFHKIVFSIEFSEHQHEDFPSHLVSESERPLYFELKQAVLEYNQLRSEQQKKAAFENLATKYPTRVFIDPEGNRVVQYSEIYEAQLL